MSVAAPKPLVWLIGNEEEARGVSRLRLAGVILPEAPHPAARRMWSQTFVWPQSGDLDTALRSLPVGVGIVAGTEPNEIREVAAHAERRPLTTMSVVKSPADYIIAGAAGASFVLTPDLETARLIGAAVGDVHPPMLVQVTCSADAERAAELGVAGIAVGAGDLAEFDSSPIPDVRPPTLTTRGSGSPAEWNCERPSEVLIGDAIRRPNTVEIDLDAIRHNIAQIRGRIGNGTRLFAALKANAYGFGIVEVGHLALSAGVDAISVADPADALRLRQHGVTCPILLYSGTLPSRELVALAESQDLTLTASDERTIDAYAGFASSGLRVFVEVDIGLERLGAYPSVAVDLAERVARTPLLSLDGIYGHPHVTDGVHAAHYLQWQYARFVGTREALRSRGVHVPVAMIASSAVLEYTSEMRLDAVDPGHILFGLVPPGPGGSQLDLRPALSSLKTTIISERSVSRERYQHLLPFRATRGVRFGVIPIGLADGIQALTCSEVLVRGRRVAMLGYPSLEHSRIDLTTVPAAEPGDEVVLIGSQGSESITVEEVARSRGLEVLAEVPLAMANSINRRYLGAEVLCRGREDWGARAAHCPSCAGVVPAESLH